MDIATTSPPSSLTPYYADDSTTIYHGDSQGILPLLNLRAHARLHVVTDPPYGIGLDYGEREDSWRPDWSYWALLYECTPANTSLHMTVSNKHLPFWLGELQIAGWEYLHCSVYWNDTREGGNWNGQFAYAWEPMLHLKKPGSEFRLGKRMMTDVFKHDGSRTTLHPAERDISAWSSFVSHLPEGLILDPFLGSGTTLRSCQDLGRSSIGIEREERWCREAALRCSQMSLFAS